MGDTPRHCEAEGRVPLVMERQRNGEYQNQNRGCQKNPEGIEPQEADPVIFEADKEND